jgi:hypothetical protein
LKPEPLMNCLNRVGYMPSSPAYNLPFEIPEG